MIPLNILTKTALKRHLWFWVKGGIGIFFLFVVFYLVQNNWFAKQKKIHYSDVSTVVQISEKIDQTQETAEKIKVKMQDLSLKSGILATMTNRQFYYDILAVLSDAFNDSTWIDHLSIQRGKVNETDISTVWVEGFSLTHNTLGNFLESLSGIHRVQNVVLDSAKKNEQTLSGLNLSSAIRFKLTCSILKAESK